MLPLEQPQKAARSFLKIGLLFSFSLFSCPSLAHLRLLILFVLISGNVYPNRGPIFPCSVCAGKVTWWGKSVHCCTCSKWVHLKCSQLFSKIRTFGAAPCCVPTRNTVTSSPGFSNIYTSTVQSGPASANAALPPQPRLQTFYSSLTHSVSSPSAPLPPSLAPGCPSTRSAFSP